MAEKSVIVIGAGVAGLSAGVYAAANGYDTRLFEMHTLPGGLCTSWEREGFTFDGCIHWLVGTKPGTAFRPLWDEVCDVDALGLVHHDEFSRIRGADGQELVFWSDLDRTEREMLERWPGDRDAIKALVSGSRKAARLGSSVPDSPPDLMKAFDGLKVLVKSGTAIAEMPKLQSTSVADFSERFHDPFLRNAMKHCIQEPRMSLLALMSTLGWFEQGDAVWVEGGSLVFAKAIERRLREAGGQVAYGTRVERILVEDDRAVGVRLADGSEHRADHVISAADGHATIFDMLEGRYLDDQLRELYGKLEPFTPIIQLSLGVDRDLSGEPYSVTMMIDPPMEVAGVAIGTASCQHYSYDPSMAPLGKSVVTLICQADLAHWQSLRDSDRTAYKAEKKRVAEQLFDLVERAYPGTAGQVCVWDMATPATYVRYTGNWRGSFEGWLLSPENAKLVGMQGMPRRLPGLANFIMAGQWVLPGGGLPTGVLTGRWAVKNIMHDDGRKFVSPSA